MKQSPAEVPTEVEHLGTEVICEEIDCAEVSAEGDHLGTEAISRPKTYATAGRVSWGYLGNFPQFVISL